MVEEDPRGRIRNFVIHPTKLDGYVLNLAHPQGGPKAARLLRHNFDAASLRPVLIDHGRTGVLSKAWVPRWGIRLEIAAPLPTPLNRYIDVVTVWQVRPSEPSRADFITLLFASRRRKEA